MFFTGVFFTAIAGFIILLDKRRWRSLCTIGLVALVLALIAELIAQVYPTWDFVGNEKWLFISLSNATIYTLSACLFIQWYPSNKNKTWKIAYWFGWTTYAAILEYVYLRTGHMKYFENWTFWHSYCADLLLYWIFYQCYRILRLERLDHSSN